MTIAAPPEPSVEGYQAIVGLTQEAPAWVRAAIAAGSLALIIGSIAVFIAVIWRARGKGMPAMALAVLAPVATTVAYVIAETVKVLVEEERPCRALGNVMTISACPPSGDWSFPSNHAVVAGAVAVAALVVWRRLAAVVVPVGAPGRVYENRFRRPLSA
ncbi:phosphatase PAP2 family protein [Streptosporangium lutulentum]